MARTREMKTNDAPSADADIRTQQALDQAAGGSGEIDTLAPGIETLDINFTYSEPGSDDSRSTDTPDCDRQRQQALDAAAGRIAEAVRASQPREHHTTRNVAMLAIGGLAGFLLHGILRTR
ncbi:hypothetical protein [Rhizobium leucaenae]|uniref:Uncharacterized protein n=1 Tax=Rhizobium leucaenae TaxID=29450 RepID=A0A7W6ZS65_9HYPH|nr:hypothetical protein [Rhizobium leucaenae]MBB4567250.1 hypothetical protein [Rhizobium leucaenae]MBB6304270.1 hypothetical protein [Rhizobium leucaenae]